MDGVGLTRVAEIMQGDHTNKASKELKIPPVSDLQKILNLQKTANALHAAGLQKYEGKLLIKDQNLVLQLLWDMISTFELPARLTISR